MRATLLVEIWVFLAPGVNCGLASARHPAGLGIRPAFLEDLQNQGFFGLFIQLVDWRNVLRARRSDFDVWRYALVACAIWSRGMVTFCHAVAICNRSLARIAPEFA